MRINKMRDITVKLIDEKGKIVETKEFEEENKSGVMEPYVAYVRDLGHFRALSIHHLSGDYQINIDFKER